MGKANFGIALEGGNVEIQAGTHLRGTVFAEVEKEIKGSEMSLTFSGLEKTTVRYTVRDHDDRNSETRYAHASRPLIQVNIPVSSTNLVQMGRIQPGKYELPFDVELPAFLPSSMSVSYGGGNCEIKYSLKAILKGSGMLWNYNCDRDVIVKAKLMDTEPIPFNAQPVTEHVKVCCCINRGSMSFAAKVADTRLDRGAATNVSMSCRNRTSVRIQGVYAELEQRCHWKASSHTEKFTRTLIKQDFGHFTGLERIPVVRGDSILRQDYDEIFRSQDGVNSAQIQMPLDAFNTYQGSLISVSHKLTVKLETRCCISNPTIQIPFQVGEPRQGVSPATSAPPLTASAVVPSSFVGQANVANTIYVPSSAVSTGGMPVEGEQEPDVSTLDVATSGPPSLAILLKEMEQSVADLDLVQAKAQDPSWKPIFESLSPGDYGKILQQVDSDFDESRVAVAVAEQIGSNFTCDHVLAALGNVSDWNRGSVCEKLLPYCTDLVANQSKIKAELSDWEKMVTERAFQTALQSAR